MEITTLGMEIGLASYFNHRVNLIVPNVSWGLNLHEVDLLILTKNNYAYEVEIKISKFDLKKDMIKRHGHIDKRISRLYFAIPEFLQCSIDLIPQRAGILIVDDEYNPMRVQCVRSPKVNHDYKWTEKERGQLLRLASMRTWTLKKKIYDIKKASGRIQ